MDNKTVVSKRLRNWHRHSSTIAGRVENTGAVRLPLRQFARDLAVHGEPLARVIAACWLNNKGLRP